MCVGRIALALGLGTRGRRQGTGVDIDQGRNEKRGENCFPMNVPYQYHTRQPGKSEVPQRPLLLTCLQPRKQRRQTSLTDITLSLSDSSRTCYETFPPPPPPPPFQTLPRLTDTAILNFSRETNQAKCSPTPLCFPCSAANPERYHHLCYSLGYSSRPTMMESYWPILQVGWRSGMQSKVRVKLLWRRDVSILSLFCHDGHR